MNPSLRLPALGRRTRVPEVSADGASEPTDHDRIAAAPVVPQRDPTGLAADGFLPPDVTGSDDPAPVGRSAETIHESAAATLSSIEDALARLLAFAEVVLSWVAEDGYPMNVAIPVEVNPQDELVRFDTPAGFQLPAGREISLTGSHVRPLPGGGFDQRSHVTVWGRPAPRPRARFVLRPDRAWIWDAAETPPPVAYERSLPKARRYYEELSRQRGRRIRPHMDLRLLLFRATRAPFLSATIIPVVLGLMVAVQTGVFDPLTAALTLIAATAIHLGLNVANDVFDTLAGADDANPTPTKFSGGSRVIQNSVVSVAQMGVLAVACYLVATAIGLVLLDLRGSTALVAIAALGLAISLGYTMPPVKLVYRGFGEIATAVGFGPVMVLGAYVVQSGGTLSLAAAIVSIPVGLLVAMILYVNEIPDRAGDAMAGKRTLPIRWGKKQVIRGFDVAVGAAFAVVVTGVATAALPIPCLLTVLAVPLAQEVHRGLVRSFDNPYALMPTMALNIRLHLAVGLLLALGYLTTVLDQRLLGLQPFLW